MPDPVAERRRADAMTMLWVLLVLGLTWQLSLGIGRLARRARPAPLPVTVDLVRDPAWRLTLVPGIGPARAAAIVRTRQTRPLQSLADLDAVPGIGPGTVERLRRTRVVRLRLDGRVVGWRHDDDA